MTKKYTKKLIQESKEKFELLFGCQLSDEEVCRILHEISAVVRIVCRGKTK